MEIIRKHFIFTGSVQGVGFRYRAYYAAKLYGVKGWVRNCEDGSVEMEAQGKEASIDKLLLAIEKGRYVVIENMRVKSIPLCDSRSFVIRE